MKYAWLYFKYKVYRIGRDINTTYCILHFCWKKVVIWILTKMKYPKPKARLVRQRWQNMYFYKLALEIRQIFQKVLNPEIMAEMVFSRN